MSLFYNFATVASTTFVAKECKVRQLFYEENILGSNNFISCSNIASSWIS